MDHNFSQEEDYYNMLYFSMTLSVLNDVKSSLENLTKLKKMDNKFQLKFQFNEDSLELIVQDPNSIEHFILYLNVEDQRFLIMNIREEDYYEDYIVSFSDFKTKLGLFTADESKIFFVINKKNCEMITLAFSTDDQTSRYSGIKLKDKIEGMFDFSSIEKIWMGTFNKNDANEYIKLIDFFKFGIAIDNSNVYFEVNEKDLCLDLMLNVNEYTSAIKLYFLEKSKEKNIEILNDFNSKNLNEQKFLAKNFNLFLHIFEYFSEIFSLEFFNTGNVSILISKSFGLSIRYFMETIKNTNID